MSPFLGLLNSCLQSLQTAWLLSAVLPLGKRGKKKLSCCLKLGQFLLCSTGSQGTEGWNRRGTPLSSTFYLLLAKAIIVFIPACLGSTSCHNSNSFFVFFFLSPVPGSPEVDGNTVPPSNFIPLHSTEDSSSLSTCLPRKENVPQESRNKKSHKVVVFGNATCKEGPWLIH